MSGYADEAAAGFERSRAVFDAVVAELADPECAQVTHAELEERLTERSRGADAPAIPRSCGCPGGAGGTPDRCGGCGPVGFQNSATGPDLGFYAACSYSLMRPPRTGRRLIRFRERSATGWSGRGGWSWRLRWGRRPL